MNKTKLIYISSGLGASVVLIISIYLYMSGLKERKSLVDRIEQLETEITKEKSEQTSGDDVLGDTNEKVDSETTDTPSVVVPTVYVEPIDTDPIISCNKHECGTKDMKESNCRSTVCCEVKEGTYRLVDSSNECELLKHESARTPVTLPHNGSVYYCDKESHDAIKQASQIIKDSKADWEECDNEMEDCLDESSEKEMDCTWNCSLNYNAGDEQDQCMEGCSVYSFISYCGGFETCINVGAIDDSSLNALIDEHCD